MARANSDIYVSIIQAQALTKAGFNEMTDSAFVVNYYPSLYAKKKYSGLTVAELRLLTEEPGKLLDKEIRAYYNYTGTNEYFRKNKIDAFSMPTLEQARTWLREHKRISADVWFDPVLMDFIWQTVDMRTGTVINDNPEDYNPKKGYYGFLYTAINAAITML